MKTFKFFACLVLILNSSLSAQTVPPGLDNGLRHTLDSMRTVLGAKSLSAAIAFPDGAIWKHAEGISSAQPPVAVTPDDVYLIGSVTKTLTSACVLQLADEGLLSLDDSLHQWLDTIPYVDPNITIRQLLQHTSGIFDVLLHPHNQDSMMADITRIWTPEELIERFISPPLFQPGTSWSYCNTNYFLLGMIIKKATGNPFYTEIRNRFYTPLGLNTFAIPAFEPLNSPVAHAWLDVDGDNILDDANDFYMSHMALNSSAGAAGGYFATPADCSRWMRIYMRGDLLPAAMMAEARTTVTAPGSQGGLYGLGLMKNQTDFLGYLAYGHGGDLVYHASSWYFPAKDISITVFTNDNNKNSWLLLPVVRELLRTYNNGTTTAIAPGQGVTDAGLSIYPNPFKDRFTIELSAGNYKDKVEVTLQDVLGKVMVSRVQKPAGKSLQLDGFGSLAPGLYFGTLKTKDEGTKTFKIVKE